MATAVWLTLLVLFTPVLVGLFLSTRQPKEENAQRQAMRKDTISETGHSMVEETMGEVLSIMSEV